MEGFKRRHVTAEEFAKAPEKRTERKVSFNLHLPESLYERLKVYVENYGRRHESMTRVIVEALERELAEREARRVR